jgi:hypothetical protein
MSGFMSNFTHKPAHARFLKPRPALKTDKNGQRTDKSDNFRLNPKLSQVNEANCN